MQAGNLEFAATDPATQFTAAIAQNAAAYLDLPLPQSISAGRTCRARLRSLAIVSTENTGWEVWLFTRSRTGAETIADTRFLGKYTFTAASAVRIAAAGLYYYYIDGIDLPYIVDDVLPSGVPDEDGQRKNLHMALVARESAKAADAAGAVTVRFVFEPTLGI